MGARIRIPQALLFIGVLALSQSSPASHATWNFHTLTNNLGQPDGCKDTNLAAVEDVVFAVAAHAHCTEDIANNISRGRALGTSWSRIYPPAPPPPAPEPAYPSIVWGGEGDIRAYQDELIYLGQPRSVTNAVVAISLDRGSSWNPLVPIPTDGYPAFQPWLHLGPQPSGTDAPTYAYYLLAWFRNIEQAGQAGVGTFSTNGGTAWGPLTLLPRDFVDHVLCVDNASQAGTSLVDERIPHPDFAGMRAGPRGDWGTDGKFYWVMLNETRIYVCSTEDLGVTWSGVWLSRPPDLQATSWPLFAFDELGTLHLIIGNKLLVSLDQGRNFPFLNAEHNLPFFQSEGADIMQWFAARNGFVHVIVQIPNGGADCAHPTGCWAYMRGRGDAADPAWTVDTVAPDESSGTTDFVQIVLDGDGRPILGYTFAGTGNLDYFRMAYRTEVP